METKFVLLIFAAISNICVISSSNINLKWPQDDSKPFPYPTHDPIDINPFTTPLITTPKPLTITGNLHLLATLTNTGSTLVARQENSSMPVTAIGGVLYNDIYQLFEQEYFWDLSLKRAAGISFNGKGASVQVLNSFFNTKYGTLENAMTKRDGIFQAVVFISVGPFPNPKFIPSTLLFPLVKKAGSSITIPATLNTNLLQSPPIRQDYYAYPGQYDDIKTGKTYFSATIVTWNLYPITISYKQFKKTFGSLENKSGKSYSHIARQYPRGKRPVKHVVFSGMSLKFGI